MTEGDARFANAFFTAKEMMWDRNFSLHEDEKEIVTVNNYIKWESETKDMLRKYVKGNTLCWIVFSKKIDKKELHTYLLPFVGIMKEEKMKGVLIIIAPSLTPETKKVIRKFSPPPRGFPLCEHNVKDGDHCDDKIEVVPGLKKIRSICINNQCITPVIEYFTLTAMQKNPTLHWLVPKHTLYIHEGIKKNLHEVLRREAVKDEFRPESNILIEALARILPPLLMRDPIVKWYGGRVGDLFFIERNIPNKSTAWKIVIPSYSRKGEKPLKKAR